MPLESSWAQLFNYSVLVKIATGPRRYFRYNKTHAKISRYTVLPFDRELWPTSLTYMCLLWKLHFAPRQQWCTMQSCRSDYLSKSQCIWQKSADVKVVSLAQRPITFDLIHLCPGKDYWADFNNFLCINPSDDPMKKIIFLDPTPPHLHIISIWEKKVNFLAFRNLRDLPYMNSAKYRKNQRSLNY